MDATGSCICGAVTISVNVGNSVGACHCDICRRWGGGPLLALDGGDDVAGNDQIAKTEIDYIDVDTQNPAVAVTSPNGGENWVAGSSHDITWSATDVGGFGATPIALDYSVNSGGSWISIAPNCA